MEATHICPECRMLYFEPGECNWCSPTVQVIPYQEPPKPPRIPVQMEEE